MTPSLLASALNQSASSNEVLLYRSKRTYLIICFCCACSGSIAPACPPPIIPGNAMMVELIWMLSLTNEMDAKVEGREDTARDSDHASLEGDAFPHFLRIAPMLMVPQARYPSQQHLRAFQVLQWDTCNVFFWHSRRVMSIKIYGYKGDAVYLDSEQVRLASHPISTSNLFDLAALSFGSGEPRAWNTDFCLPCDKNRRDERPSCAP